MSLWKFRANTEAANWATKHVSSDASERFRRKWHWLYLAFMSPMVALLVWGFWMEYVA